MQYQNPIIPGYNPDPSICRVGDDFYLVTSTFEFFPGVPIYHSKNLVNWELVNYCLTTDTQLPLQGCRPSGGIYAPTIRYHDGMFYMVTTNVTHKGNFIVHTDDIRGQWSEPAWVKQGGIDPSLFWDEDGTCYFVSNGSDKGERGIYLCKINPLTGEMLTPSRLISKGCGGKAAEAPHIYKRDGWYYLMLAEGGTEYGHMETMQRAKEIFGPYEEGPRHPILTHREDNSDYLSTAIQATGHADIIEDQNGNWWLVCLAIRPIGHVMLHNIGRETFLAPLVWDEAGWPIVGNEGRIRLVMDAPLPGPAPTPVSHNFSDGFDGETLDLNWNFVRNPERKRYILQDSCITLHGGETTLSTPGGSPTMIALRQQAFVVSAEAKMAGPVAMGQKSGLTAFYNHSAHYDLFVTQKEDGCYICLGKQVYDIDCVTASQKIDYQGEIELKVDSDNMWYTFSFRLPGGQWAELGRGMTAPLCTEATCMMTFTGTFIGLFSERGKISFDSFGLTANESLPNPPARFTFEEKETK